MAKAKKKVVAQVEDISIDETTVHNEHAEAVAAKTAKLEPIQLDEGQSSVYAGFKTKSEKIRYLSGEGYTNGQIANYLGIRYQHVRNVLTTPLKRPQAK